MTNTLNIPQSPPINIQSGNWSPEWLQWIINPKFLSLETGEALGVASGGTGITATPGANQLLVGNGTGYSLSSTVPANSLPAFTGDVTKPAASSVQTLATVNTNVGSWGSATAVASFTVNGKGLITAASSVNITGAAGAFTVTGAFGCNGATAQTTYSVNAAVSGTAGAAYTATEQAMINDLKALANQMRALLVANGQAA
jgi:hypothetical protein